MEFGWRRWVNTVVATATITSAFWVILGGWLHYRSDGGSDAGKVPPTHPTAGVAPPAQRPLPSGLIVPVVGVAPAQLTDTFTQARAGGVRRHDAIDIMAAEGTPVVAAAPGRVEKLFLSHDGGNTVYVRSADGDKIYYYAHLLDYAPGLAEGARIARGASIGRVGHTGDASPDAPHLHFALIQTRPDARWSDEGVAINPYPLLGGK